MGQHNIDSKLIMKDLKDILNVFKKFDVPIYLAYGALLGAVREKDFIKWDDDVDLEVTKPIDFKTRKLIGRTLRDLGFKTQPIAIYMFGEMEPLEEGYNGDENSGLIAMERNFKFSIFFYTEKENHYICIPKRGTHHIISIPTRFYSKPSNVKLHGELFITPGPINEYLTFVYGSNWKTPIENLHAPNCINNELYSD